MTRLLQRVQEIEARFKAVETAHTCQHEIDRPWGDCLPCQRVADAKYELKKHAPADLTMAAKLLRIVAEAGCSRRSYADCRCGMLSCDVCEGNVTECGNCLACRIRREAESL